MKPWTSWHPPSSPALALLREHAKTSLAMGSLASKDCDEVSR